MVLTADMTTPAVATAVASANGNSTCPATCLVMLLYSWVLLLLQHWSQVCLSYSVFLAWFLPWFVGQMLLVKGLATDWVRFGPGLGSTWFEQVVLQPACTSLPSYGNSKNRKSFLWPWHVCPKHGHVARQRVAT